ncbi:DNA-protecting protein DprA [Chitinophaga sp. SYP-B3965]|uniref:DNA-processing protein DprA n=1 Tax=Chitinophaga sp. SYP-B3965 TaxID=2663120 RepID=UPI00129A0525|nr:DNA-processing protein DprA [Chitinophaga sp. SYP-B3965]MRG48152.1 DNA-protecting protein DprA [Chitinophaga sp. SYP-B3965]
MCEEIFNQVALTLIPQIGDVVAKELLAHFGNAADIFSAKRRTLERIPGVGEYRANAIKNFCDHHTVEKEIVFMEQHHVAPIFYTAASYPERLRHCYDSPVMLYNKGAATLQASKMLGIVGTRQPTAYGIQLCEQFIDAFKDEDITIVSGLAYGIDITAHRAALRAGLPTIGVLAHGLHTLYPAAHHYTAQQMQQQGGLLTDFPSSAPLNKQNFPRRNRIVAGICDAILVIESGVKGGSLITADIAASYNRDVMAIPGRIGDPGSAGCLELIKQNKASLVTSPQDVLETLNWRPLAPQPVQQSLFYQLDSDEQVILKLLAEHKALHLDEILHRSALSRPRVSEKLMQLEMMAKLRPLPGNTYELINT